MNRIITISAVAAVAILACGSNDTPVGIGTPHYWDIAWSSPDTALTDIEMLAADQGWACGHRYSAATNTYDALVLQYDGTTWDVNLFLAGDAGARLFAIDFVSAKDGWALGSRDWGISGPVVLHYDGESWTEVSNAGLAGGQMNLLAAVGENDVWVSDGFTAYHFDGGSWTPYAITSAGAVDRWVFPNANVGWAVDYDSGYCYRWDAETLSWIMEPYPLYNITAFYFKGDGSGYYADYIDIPRVTQRTNIYERIPGETPAYERVYSSGRGRRASAAGFLGPEYYFFAGPDTSFRINKGHIKAVDYVPSSQLGALWQVDVAAEDDIWGIMGTSPDYGPSFIVHKKG